MVHNMTPYTGPERRILRGSILMRADYYYTGPNTPRQPQHDYSATVAAPMPPERTSGPEMKAGCATCDGHGQVSWFEANSAAPSYIVEPCPDCSPTAQHGCAMCGEVHGCSHSAADLIRRTAIASKPAPKQEVTETARYVKSLRARLGLTQEAFGALFGLGNMAVYQWERGHRHPSPAALKIMETLSKQNQPVDETYDDLPI